MVIFFITDCLRNRNTLEFIGIWEKVYNPNFNYGEFAIIKNQAGLNIFKSSVKEEDSQAMENAVFIEQGMPHSERLIKLNQIAIHQMSVLESNNKERKLLK